MRAVTTLALVATLVLGALAQSPWKIIEAWTKQMPGGAAMQISPAFNVLRSIYFTTSADGTVYALNTTDRNILWNRQWDDITFLQAVPELDSVLVGRGGATDLVLAATGATQWSTTGIVVQADLSNHGDRNFISFGDASNLTLVYRETGLGYTRVCALNALNGNRTWCDPTYRTSGLPDAAFNDTLTAPLFDANGQQYAGSFNAWTGDMNWVMPVQAVLTGNPWYVAVTNSTDLIALDSMTGNVMASSPFGNAPSATSSAVFVHQHILAVCDGQNWIAAMDATSGNIMWNVSTPVQRGTMQLQRRGDGVLVLAVLTDKHTNFTRFDAYEGNFMWTVSARPTGTSLAPVHAWLGNDIIYVRDVTNSWSAFGVDTGDLISTGSGNLFLPRSVAADIFEPHVGYFVTGPEGIVYDLKIVPRN